MRLLMYCDDVDMIGSCNFILFNTCEHYKDNCNYYIKVKAFNLKKIEVNVDWDLG